MEILDDLNLFGDKPQPKSYDTTENGIEFIDGDTIVNPENPELSIRFGGADTAEIGKYDNELDAWVPGQVGGVEATQMARELAAKNGFTKVVTTGKVDKYGRQLGDVVNPETGEYFSTKLLESGIAAPMVFSDPLQMNAVLKGRLDRAQRREQGNLNEWDIAGEELNKKIAQSQPLQAKAMAMDEQEYAALKFYLAEKGLDVNDYLTSTTQFRRSDRTLDNKAKSTIGTAWDSAQLGFMEATWGAFDMISDLFTGDRDGSDDVNRMRTIMGELPELENQLAFDEEGNWQLDSFSKFIDFTIGNSIQSSPYLATAILSLAHPLLLTVPSLLYSGETYAEQKDDEKNIGLAVTSGVGQAVLDRIGASFITAPFRKFLVDKSVREQLVEYLAKSKALNKKEAEQLIIKLTKDEVRSLADAAKRTVADKVKNKYLTIGAGGAYILKDGAGEALTESLQETIGFLGANNLDFEGLTTPEFQNRIANAAVAGGTLGSGFSAIGRGVSRFYDYSRAVGESDANPKNQAEDTKRRAELKEKFNDEGLVIINDDGSKTTLDNLNTDFDSVKIASQNYNEEETLADTAEPETKKRQARSFVGDVVEGFKEHGFLGGFRAFSNATKAKYKNRGVWTDMFLASMGAGKVFSSANAETQQHLDATNIINTISTEADAIESFGVRNTDEVSNILYDPETISFLDAVSGLIGFNPNINSAKDAVESGLVTIPAKFIKYREAYLDYADRIHELNKKYAEVKGLDIRKVNLLKDKTWDKAKIAANKVEFIELLKQELGLSHADAVTATDNIIYQLDNDLVDATSLDLDEDTINKIFEAALEGEDIGLDTSKKAFLNNPKFADYFHTNFFYNLSGIAGVTASAKVNKEFFGKNGSRLNYLLKQAVRAGEITQEEASFLAREGLDLLEMRQGKYKAIESDAYKIAQSYLITFTSLVSLPLAPVSATVELIGTLYNVPLPVITKNIVPIVHAFMQESMSYLRDGLSAATGGRISKKAYLEGARGEMAKLGYLLESQSAAQRNDVQISQGHQKFMDGFFKFIGLQGVTNFTRTIRTALAADTIYGLLVDVALDKKLGKVTVQGNQSREMLQRLGLDVDKAVYDFVVNGELDNNTMQMATFNFVNEVIPHPTKSNRPKFYQNPRLALFTQFQGFISTFTSTVLPVIFGQAFGKGKVPAARVEAVRNMAFLIAFGLMSTYLRDFLKTGGDLPDEDDIVQRLRRGVGASGLLGTGERIVNLISPMYPDRNDNAFEAAVSIITGEAPALTTLGKVGTAATDVFDFEESGKEWKKLAKATPLLGPFHKQFEEDSDSMFRSAIDGLFEKEK